MTKKLILAVLAVALLFPAAAMARTATITWVPPDARTDGTPLGLDEIAGYVFSCRPDGATDHVDLIDIMPGTLDTYVTTYQELFGDVTGTYQCAMRTVDTAGLESPLSDEVIVRHLAGPNAPTDIEIVFEKPSILQRFTNLISKIFW